MTYSVYNIKVDNQLSFTPGATAGYVLGINSDGSTSWIEGGGGSQTLEQVLANGNNVGTYSIVGASNGYPYIAFATASGEINLGAYVSISDGASILSGTLQILGITSSLLATDLTGKIIATSSVSGTSGTSGISGTAGTSGTSGISGTSGTSGTSPNQNLQQVLANENYAGTYSIILATGSLSNMALSFQGKPTTGIYNNFGNEYMFYSGGSRALWISGARTIFQETSTAALPALTFGGDLDTGIFRPGANEVAISTGGITSSVFNTSGLRIPQLSNTLLAVNSIGQVVATSSTGGGSQTLEQTLALGNNPGTYSIETSYGGDFKRLVLSATYSDNLSNILDNTYLMTGTWSNFVDVYKAASTGKFNIDTAYLMINNNSANDPISGSDASLTSIGNSQSHQVYVAKNQAGIIAIENAIGGVSKSVGIGSNMTFGNFIWDDRAQQGVNSLANKFLYVNNSGFITGTSSTGGGGSTTGSIGIVLDGAGTTITTGVKSSIQIPYSGTITGWTILADQVGSIVVDVWKDNYATYPPSSLDSIAGTEKPTLSSSIKNEDNSLSTWTTSVSAGDIITFNVDSASTLTRVNLAIKITKS